MSLTTRIRRSLKPPRYLSLTRAGKFFLLMTLAVGFGAINTGNNLLFLLLGMTLSLIVASGVLSEAVLRNLKVRRRLPRRFVAGEPAPGRFRVVNEGWWPALSVEAAERNPKALAGPAAGDTVGPDRIPWWKFWKPQPDDQPVGSTYCMRVGADDEQPLQTRYKLPVRGRFRLAGPQLRTRFPFALFEKSRHFSAPTEITVLPDGAEADEWIGKLQSRWGDTTQNRRGRGHEFYGLRDYRPGEDRRLIHWKSTARRGEPVVRETEARHRRALLIVFDNRRRPGTNTDTDDADDAALFEAGIRHLVGLLNALRSRGYTTELLTTDGHVTSGEEGDVEPLLRHLATIEMHNADAPSPLQTADADDLPQTRLHVGFSDHLPAESDDCTTFSIDDLTDTKPR